MHPSDSRAVSAIATVSRAAEIDGLLQQKSFRVANGSKFLPDANVLGGRFVFSTEDKGAVNERFKARWVFQGFADIEKIIRVHASTTLRYYYIRVVLSCTATL